MKKLQNILTYIIKINIQIIVTYMYITDAIKHLTVLLDVYDTSHKLKGRLVTNSAQIAFQ